MMLAAWTMRMLAPPRHGAEALQSTLGFKDKTHTHTHSGSTLWTLDAHTIGATQEESKHFSHHLTNGYPSGNKLNHTKPPHRHPPGSISHKEDLVEADQKRNKLLVHFARVARPLCLSPLWALELTLARVQDDAGC